MLQDEAFMKFWQVKHPGFRIGIDTIAFIEVAYEAWLAAYDLGFDEGKATSQAISNDVLNFGKRKNNRG